jgi:hypothetical protein
VLPCITLSPQSGTSAAVASQISASAMLVLPTVDCRHSSASVRVNESGGLKFKWRDTQAPTEQAVFLIFISFLYTFIFFFLHFETVP